MKFRFFSLLATFFVTSNASALGVRMDRQPQPLACQTTETQINCKIKALANSTVTIDLEKSLTGMDDSQGYQQLKSAIEQNDLSRILLCMHPGPKNYIVGILLNSNTDPNQAFAILVSYTNQPDGSPLIVFPPQTVPLTGLQDTQACDQYFK
jgi:hypothetical protein